MGLRARSLALLHDSVAVEDSETVDGDGEDQGDQEQPAGSPAEPTEHIAKESDTKGLGTETTFSLVSVDSNGAGTA